MNDAGADTQGSNQTQRRLDLVATVLLSLATLAAAWAGYQSTRWHSEQAKSQAKATASRIESARAAGVASREGQVDIALFVQWVDARAAGKRQLADFYRDSFTDRFEPAFNSWIATKPFTNPDAPTSPFVTDAYKLEASKKADRLEATANAASAQAVEDIRRADRYVLAVVLLASCLFFAGISTRLRTTSAQYTILALGCIMFCLTTLWLLTFPITVVV